MQLHPNFAILIDKYLSHGLALEQGTIFGMWPDLTLAYTNDGWDRFAEANDGSQVLKQFSLGCSVPQATSAVLQPFFVENYQRCLAELRPWEHLYECSSPEVFRRLKMTVFPLGNAEGLLVVNATCIEKNHAREPFPAHDHVYRDQFGLVHQCAHCRRVRRTENERIWDWIPDWVRESPKNTSHGLCVACATYYYFAAWPNNKTHPQPFQSTSPKTETP